MKDSGKHFYNVIEEIDLGADNWMITVLSGSHSGEKALISSGELKWTSDDDGFIPANAEKLIKVTECGITEVCGTEVYAELLSSEKQIVVCGAGHISIPIITIGKMTGFRVVVIDDRLHFVNNAIDAGADEVIFREFGEALDGISGGKNTFFVIVTRGHRYDKDCLRKIVKKPHAYIGMIGSRRRAAIVRSDLINEGISDDILDSIYSPIGLDIGARTPEEIAVAIMAEIIQVSNEGNEFRSIPNDILETLRSDNRERVTLATIVSRQGSAPRDIGTKMLIMRDGSIIGTIGGGCVEGNVIAKGRRMLLNDHHEPVIMEIDMSGRTAEDEGMVCGGKVRVLLEVV